MNKEYVNPLGQRVVEVEFGGYKVYDSEQKDRVLLRVGGTAPDGSYIYKDKDAFESGDDVCFIPENAMNLLESFSKGIVANEKLTDSEKKKEFFFVANEGARKSDIIRLYGTEEDARIVFENLGFPVTE